MTRKPLCITSPGNPRIKTVVKLRRRPHRDTLGLLLVEGYREIKRALDNRHPLEQLFFCRDLFQGKNEDRLLERAAAQGAELFDCTSPVFARMSYRDRPEGLLAVGPQVGTRLEDLNLPDPALIVVAEAVEKPGNLGTILRTADAAGCHAVLVCDAATDINNPNVVRASIGTLFCVPVVQTDTERALEWLRQNRVLTVAATPHTRTLYTQADYSRSTAIVLGTEQYGLSETWLTRADLSVRIPMQGQSDSLNVAAAATILLYEVLRQRAATHGVPSAPGHNAAETEDRQQHRQGHEQDESAD